MGTADIDQSIVLQKHVCGCLIDDDTRETSYIFSFFLLEGKPMINSIIIFSL